MKRIILLLNCVLCVLVMLGGAAGAATVRTFDDALKKAGKKKPIVVFCYGVNYDKLSDKAYEMYVRRRDKNITRVVGGEIFLVIPVYQLPNEKEKREFEKVMGKRGLPGGIWSVPSFAVMDGGGNIRGAVRDREQMEDPAKAAEALDKLLKDFDKQQKLIEDAERASGEARKERLTREALSYGDLKVPGRSLFDPSQNGIVEKLQIMSIPAANNFIRSTLNNGVYSRIERQMVMAAYAGHVRRQKGPTYLLRAIYTEMRNIDPTSIYGAYAEGALELWVVPNEKEATSGGGKAASEKDKDTSGKGEDTTKSTPTK